MGEEAGYDYEEVTEAIIDVEDIIEAYAHPDVLHKAGMLLKDYKVGFLIFAQSARSRIFER